MEKIKKASRKVSQPGRWSGGPGARRSAGKVKRQPAKKEGREPERQPAGKKGRRAAGQPGKQTDSQAGRLKDNIKERQTRLKNKGLYWVPRGTVDGWVIIGDI